MVITLADQYYLKALDEYPYNLEDAVENLNYALSYDSEHAGANYLMGKLYMEQFQKFELAEEYFVSAMAADPCNINTCESFSWLLFKTRQFKKALTLLKYSYSVKGVNVSEFKRLEALVYESLKEFNTARELLSTAIEECYDSEYIAFLEEEMKRVERKSLISKSGMNYQLVG